MRSRAVLGNKTYSPYTCPTNADYAICSVGLGPVSGGTVVNLHDGSVYPVKGGSLSTVASTATGIINRGNKSNLEFGKSILKNVSAKGGGCSFGTITNKPKNQPRSDFVNEWLPGRGFTVTLGLFGLTGGATVPESQKIFSLSSQIGLEKGVGTTVFDYSETETGSKPLEFKFIKPNKVNNK